MSVFLCNEKCLRAGMEDIPPATCHVCEQESMYTDWCGAMCHTCGADIESTRQESIRSTRERAGLTVQDIALKIGVDCKEVEHLEGGSSKFVPDEYWMAFSKVIKQYYEDNTGDKKSLP